MMSFTKGLLITSSAALLLAACGEDTTSPQKSIETTEVTEVKGASVTQESDRNASEGRDATDRGQESEINVSYNDFLEKYVIASNDINLVAYDKVTDEDEASLEAYIETLVTTDMTSMSTEEKMAHWFNLYNAKTVDLILDNYPLESIKDIRKPWDQKLLTVNGQKMSLNDVEHETLRKNYDEPRIHFAVNCASIGCPNLKLTAWEASTLDQDLDQAGRDYIASARGIKVEGDDIDASKIFKWYDDDFGSNEKEVLNYLSQFATGSKKTAMQNAKNIDDYDYDWSLNIAQ